MTSTHATRVLPRAGFTLLELMLAVVVGSMVVVLSIALLTSIERSNGMMGQRTEQTAEMQVARLVMNRAFNTILASQPPQNQGRAPAVARAEGEPAPPPERLQAPRVMLDIDTSAGGVMERRELDGSITSQGVQRLEIVLLDSPVPPAIDVDPFALARLAKREADRKSRATEQPAEGQDESLDAADTVDEPSTDAPPTDDEASTEENAVEDGDLRVRAIRGVFEFREQLVTAARREQLRESVKNKRIYELWWRPMASPTSAEEWTAMSRGERMIETVRLGKPVRLAGDITFARWRMFDDREKRTTYEATQYNQLPAYAEFEVETTVGLRHQWLFEIGWAIGPETSIERDAARTSGVNTPVNKPAAESAGAGPGGSGNVGPGTGAVNSDGVKSGGGK
jgi:prepilin-type N-terminal cleavage/methylation domain-containing protein